MNRLKNEQFFCVICVFSAYIIQGSLSGINTGLASLMEAYPQYSAGTVMLASTLVSLFSIPTNLFFSVIVTKLGYKKTSILGLGLFLTGGLTPFVITDFRIILMFRVLLALGYGMTVPMGAALAGAYFKDDNFKAKVIGWGTIVINSSSILFAMAAGYLILIEVRYMWLVNLICALPFIIALYMPEPERKPEEIRRSKKGFPVQPGYSSLFTLFYRRLFTLIF